MPSGAIKPGTGIEVDPCLTHTTTLLYKARNGELKEIHVTQPLNPDQQKLGFRELQILAQEISKVLREDG